MVQNNQKGKTIFGVIAVIAVIALLCLLFVYICKNTHASKKANEIAESVATRIQLYCPKIQIHPQNTDQKYTQNGPHGATIILFSEDETPQLDPEKDYFSVVVDATSKSVCKKLIKSDIFKADLITIDEKLDGQCPGKIRFYFTCPYELDADQCFDGDEPSFVSGEDIKVAPHFAFSNPKKAYPKLKCKEPTPYEDKKGNCVECITASQCHESQDCVENMCQDCPAFSTRTVRIGQRIGTRNCYCQEGYQLNIDQTKCIPTNHDWNISENCVGNNCSLCPEHANKNKGQRIGMTNCYCDDGYLPRQTGTTQWQCAKVVVLYPEADNEKDNQIIIHDEKYPVVQPRPAISFENKKMAPQPQKPLPPRQPVIIRRPQPVVQSVMPAWDELFEPIFTLDPMLLPEDVSFDIRAWESLEITIR